LLLLGAAETARELADTEPGGSVASDLGYALAEAICEMYIVAGAALGMGGLIYLLSSYLRGRRVTLLEAIFENWAVTSSSSARVLAKRWM
jgi:hypothetical protein